MRTSELFTRTSKTVPGDETSKNAKLLIQSGYIAKEMAGVYTFLPLGLRTLENIVQIIREEMNAIGGQEMKLTALQGRDVWEASGRWDKDIVDVWFRTELASGTELGLAFTHEEPLTSIMKNFISSYKDLPSYPYQFQNKFRNELRSKSGLMRGREFMMKDLYSFSRDRKQHEEFYEQCAAAYMRIFERLGIGDITYRTFASGGSFAKFSDEFQTLSPVGEDTIYVHAGKRIAVNQEVYTDEVLKDLGIKKTDLKEHTAVEVGNIFTLGTKYSDVLGLNYTTEDGTQEAVFMGSYGIGPSRLMGLLAEHFADDNGLVWPENVAPFKVSLVRLGDDKAVVAAADKLYKDLESKGVTVLYDDSDKRAGEKFADADLLGMPWRVVVSAKTIEAKAIECKRRTAAKSDLVTADELFKLLAARS
jgi:prolyl-tRNA synthetase